ncbi:tetratricopeptide repeat protein (plasmid) [Phyllobacterium sp. A18/5-2]|uniref:tetratricopeptide repeat protein n=1 Tax=Phyllobacterium sp. A18/5-2 TaxID=2978392 RepID=UPI0021C95D36|nr:tetratricopeptide repeat protein [Phyllobacterium sp. A18/5-2]UXN66466.1 tetratricopeptide repeat protein [Phyllobacterium sp. A18/5-2]
MGVLELMIGNFDEALAHHRKAMDLNPTDAYIKARCAAMYNFVGESERALALLDEAETLDPFLPVWCIEERGVALYALGRYAESVESLGKLTFQTIRSRLYRAAALVALNRTEEASRTVREAVGGKPDLTASDFISREYYRDPDKARGLGRSLKIAGLPP